MTQDIFDFNIRYRNDIAFTHMNEVMYYVLNAITANLDKFVNLIEQQTIDFKSSGTVFSNAGYFFNNSQISSIVKLYSDEDFMMICTTFKNQLLESNIFRSTASTLTDPIKCFIYFTKYFYIPVRVDISSFVNGLDKDFAKRWLSCVSILLNLELYTVKFNTTIPTLEVYHECLRKIFQDQVNMLNKFKLQTVSKIKGYLVARYNPDHRVSIFYATMAKLIYNASSEIITKFCPNYRTVRNINPNYDGAWISPLDTDVGEQIVKLRECSQAIFA